MKRTNREATSSNPAGRVRRVLARIRDAWRVLIHGRRPVPAAGDERYRELFDRVPIGLYRTTPDGRILEANRAAARMMGYEGVEELLRANVMDMLVRPEQRREWKARLERDGVLRGFELEVERKDGSRLRALDTVRAVTDENGRVLYYEGALEDVTERKRVEGELRETNQKLQAVVDSSPLAIIALDREGRVTSWNRAAEEIFGWPASEALGGPPPFVPDENQGEFRALFQQVMKGEAIVDRELRRQRRDGSEIQVSLWAAPLFDADGGVRGTMAVAADITDRKRAEEMRRQLVEILEATSDLVGMARPDGQHVYLNPAGRRLLGIGPDEPIEETNIREFHPEDSPPILDEVVATDAREDGVWSGETEFLTRDGGRIPVLQVVIAHRDPDGEITLLSTIARDIRERKALEERLRETQKLEAIGRLAGGVAHDFNNLLTAIMGHCALLQQDLAADDPGRADVKSIQEAATRAGELTRELLAFGRRQILRPRVLDLNDVVLGMERLLDRIFGVDVDVEIELDPNPAHVSADPAQLEQVIVNLAVNAREAMGDQGTFEIRTGHARIGNEPAPGDPTLEPGAYVTLTARDTGRGMDEETRSRVFEPFFSTKRESPGSGLGLPSVYGIVRQSGGAIQIDSEPGAGSTFTIWLPAAAADAAAPAEAADVDAPTDGDTILLVEDEPSVRAVASRALRSVGYDVVEAANGPEALDLVGRDTTGFDMLITDVVMPEMRGTELADRLRQQRPDLRVIYISGYSEDELLGDKIDRPGSTFLAKPFTPGELRDAVEAMMGRG